MAGPTSSILIKEYPDDKLKDSVYQLIDEISVGKKDGDFYLSLSEGSLDIEQWRPFMLEIGLFDVRNQAIPEAELCRFEARFGFMPKGEIVICANCNSKDDHKLLGELTLTLAETLNGIINFHGQLVINSLEMYSKVLPVEYELADGGIGYIYLANVGFLKDWLAAEEFHMVK